MIRPQRYFPWRIARQIFLSQFFFVLATLVLTGFSLRYFVYTNFLDGQEIHVALAKFDAYLTSLFLTILIGATLYLALSARYYARPLGRLIQRARELRRLDVPPSWEHDENGELHEEPGEWADLERALNRIHSDLRSKTDALGREREELSALLGAVSDAILAVDQEENIRFFNTQFAVLFRMNQARAKNPSLGEMFRVPEVLRGYREVLKTGHMTMVNASIHTPQSSIPRHFSISIAPLRSREDGAIYGAIGVFHDITELKQSEQIRIEFVGNASHELRTPLTSIKGYVDTLRDDLKAGRLDGASQFIEIISRNVDRLTFLVNDLLDLSVIESGAELSKGPVSTREVTEAALKALESKRAAKRQLLVGHFDTEDCMGDPRRIEQVLINLIYNAIKYIPEGKRIDVCWERAKDATILRVRDNGPGIPPEHQARLFERFYRIDTGRSRDQGGTGLGLAIVKHIMLKHGGSVRIQSRLGEGAEFICTFPD